MSGLIHNRTFWRQVFPGITCTGTNKQNATYSNPMYNIYLQEASRLN